MILFKIRNRDLSTTKKEVGGREKKGEKKEDEKKEKEERKVTPQTILKFY